MNALPWLLVACDGDPADARILHLHLIHFEEDGCGPLLLVARTRAEARATDAALQAKEADTPTHWRPLPADEVADVAELHGARVALWKVRQ